MYPILFMKTPDVLTETNIDSIMYLILLMKNLKLQISKENLSSIFSSIT